MPDVPLYAKYVKGSTDAAISGELVEDLPVDSLANATAERLLPTNPQNNYVVRRTGGHTQWGAVPTPNFQAVVDRLAPNILRFERNYEIGTGQQGKHQTIAHHWPASGEITLTWDTEELAYALDDDGELYVASLKAGDRVNGKVAWTKLGLLPGAYNHLAYDSTSGLCYGIIEATAGQAGGEAIYLYLVDLANKSEVQFGGSEIWHAITGLSGRQVINGAAVAPNGKLWVIAGDHERLYQLDPTSLRLLEHGHSAHEDHNGIIPNTLTFHDDDTTLYALANLTATNQPVLVRFNQNSGVSEQVGGGLAFGEASTIKGMTSIKEGTNRQLYYMLNNGHTYHLQINDSQSPHTTTATSRGDPDLSGVTWRQMFDASLGHQELVIDAQRLESIPTVGDQNAVSPQNAIPDASGEYFFGRKADRVMTIGAHTAHSALHEFRVYERTFNGGRPTRVSMLDVVHDIKWDQAAPTTINLRYGGWERGDILRFFFLPIFSPDPSWSQDPERAQHFQSVDFDTNSFDELNQVILHQYYEVRQAIASTSGDPRWSVLVGIGQPIGTIRVSMDRRETGDVKIWPYDTQAHNPADVGVRVYQIVRIR